MKSPLFLMACLLVVAFVSGCTQSQPEPVKPEPKIGYVVDVPVTIKSCDMTGSTEYASKNIILVIDNTTDLEIPFLQISLSVVVKVGNPFPVNTYYQLKKSHRTGPSKTFILPLFNQQVALQQATCGSVTALGSDYPAWGNRNTIVWDY
jgi:hypothetical protein